MGHVYTQDRGTTMNSEGSSGGPPVELLEVCFSEPLQAADDAASRAIKKARETREIGRIRVC